MRYILVIAQQRLTRSLIGAQLKEQGFEVIGSPSMAEAVNTLRDLGIRPYIVIIDVQEQHFSQEITDILSKACAQTPLLIIHGSWDYPQGLKWQSVAYELTTPVKIGQIVEKVKELNSCLSCDS